MTSINRVLFGSQGVRTVKEYNKVLLSGYFLLMYIGIDIFFLLVNLFNPFADNAPIFFGMMVTVFCIFILRAGWRDAAILIQLIRTNYIAFYFTYTDTNLTGNFFFFIVSGIGALALYGHQELWKGALLASCSLALFYVSILRMDEFHPASPHFFLVMNFTIAYGMAAFIIYFLNKLTHQVQEVINEKNIQLQKVNAELDRFVYSVSHDLRAPLSSISGLIQLSEKTTDLREIAEYRELMKGRIDRLEQFIRDIIHFSRNARTELITEAVPLKEVIDQTFETLRYIDGAESIHLNNHVADSVRLQTDPSRLQIILFNLISNAIQYSDPYKSRSYIDISHEDLAKQCRLRVSDNGVGIDPNHHERIFDMFYRANGNSQGSGLGLYIVRETLDRLRGTIEVKSVVGQGTEFIITLPQS